MISHRLIVIDDQRYGRRLSLDCSAGRKTTIAFDILGKISLKGWAFMTSNGYKFLGVFLLGAIVGPLSIYAYNSYFDKRILVPPATKAQDEILKNITISRGADGKRYMKVGIKGGDAATPPLVRVDTGEPGSVTYVRRSPGDLGKETTSTSIGLKDPK